MPITSTKQARIEISSSALPSLIEILQDCVKRGKAVPMVALEETNIENTFAVQTKRGNTLVYHTGERHELGRGA